MDVMTAIQGRRSIRNYSSRDIEDNKLKSIEAAKLSPSANNNQMEVLWLRIKILEKLTTAAGGLNRRSSPGSYCCLRY